MLNINAVSNSPLSAASIAKALDECAKQWWGASLSMKVGGFFIGATLSTWMPEIVPFVVATCTGGAEICMLASDSRKSSAQYFRRKLDLQDSFGWQIPNTELSDVTVRCSWWVTKEATQNPATGPYFESTEPPGPVRALENVRESAWWTKHNAEWMAMICRNIVMVAVAVSLVSLVVALQGTTEHSAQVSAAKIVTSFLLLFLSLGLIKLAIGYNSLSRKSANSEAAAERALKTPIENDELAAFKIVAEYHLDRAAGPIIPTWIWERRRASMNLAWKQHRTKTWEDRDKQ